MPGEVVDSVVFCVCDVRNRCGLQKDAGSVDALHGGRAAVVYQVHNAHVVFVFELRRPDIVCLQLSEGCVQKITD